MFEFIGVIAFAAFIGWLIGHFSGGAIDGMVKAFRAIISGFQPTDGWPRGVQEEDRETRWGTPGASSTVRPEARTLIVGRRTPVATRAVRSTTHRR
jgi:hypothetical protein